MDSVYKPLVTNIGTCEAAIMQLLSFMHFLLLYFILKGDIRRLTVNSGTFQSLP